MSDKKRTAFTVSAIVCLAVVLGFSLFLSASKKDYENSTKNALSMNTIITVRTYGENTAPLNETLISIINQLDGAISRFEENSLIYELNENKSLQSNDIANLLLLCNEVSANSGGVFDVTIGPVSSLWKFGTEEESLPDEKKIEEKLSFVDYGKIRINHSSIEISDGQEIDLGAVGKGYACDLIKEYLQKSDVKGAVVSVGGSILAYGEKNKAKDPWTVAVKHPRKENAFLGTLSVKEGFISTSGDYERYFEKDGKRYHHILDATTGISAESDLISVTVLCDNGALSDALSTACFILGKDEGRKLIEKYESHGASAVFVDKNEEISLIGDIDFKKE